MLKQVLNSIIDFCGIIFIIFILYCVIGALGIYIKRMLKQQTKIKCLCHHEYEPYSAFYRFDNGVEYEFKCKKCGKVISVQTVTDDKFKWAEK